MQACSPLTAKHEPRHCLSRDHRFLDSYVATTNCKLLHFVTTVWYFQYSSEGIGLHSRVLGYDLEARLDE